MYLNYTEYQEMGGTLDETTFNEFEFDAETKVNWYTFNRLKKETEYPPELKRCMYKLIKLLYDASQAMALTGEGSSESEGVIQAGIASQSNDGVSISYNTLSAKDMLDTVNDQIGKAIEQYLQGVVTSLGKKLLYRGLYPDE